MDWDRIRKDRERELAAYNRMANPRQYVQSGQMDRDRLAGRIDQRDIQQVADAIAKKKA